MKTIEDMKKEFDVLQREVPAMLCQLAKHEKAQPVIEAFDLIEEILDEVITSRRKPVCGWFLASQRTGDNSYRGPWKTRQEALRHKGCTGPWGDFAALRQLD
jgi:hypothetical protein